MNINKQVLKELLENAQTIEEKERILINFIKENRKDFNLKQLFITISSVSASLLSICIIYILKELFKN